MQKDKTFLGKALRAMLVAGFATAMCPVSAYAAGTNANGVQAVQQQNQIKGTVIDEMGEPMIGVTVKVKGSSNAGAITDLDGNFSVSAAAGATLEFSYVGYTTQTVKGTSAPMKIKMNPDSKVMEEVVVIGFGTVKKRDVTGSVASVKSDQILQAPTSDVATSLQGRITGLDVNDGELRIRGNRSINGSNEPLVIIDGVQGGSMSDLNPQDIESVDVLKDASSTAIYGSQGANGVIIITTKKAEKGKMSISYDGSVTGAFRADHPEYRSGTNYYNARMDALSAAGITSTDDLTVFGSAEAGAAYRANAWTNYEDLLQKSTTWSTKHTVTVAGGNEKTTARVSLGYAGNGNKWKDSGTTDRYTLRGVIDHNMYKWMSAGVNFQLTHNRSKSSPYSQAKTTDMQLGSPYGYYDSASGNYLIGNELVERPLTSSDYANPLYDAYGVDRYSSKSHSTHVVGNVYLDIHPVEGLSFKTQFNASLSNATSGSYTDGSISSVLTDKGGSIENPSGTNTATMSKSSSTYLEWNNILNYNFTFLPKDHHLGVTLLTTWGYKRTDGLDAVSKGQIVASNLWYNMASNDGNDGSVTHASSYTQSQTFSYAGRISYDWKSRYLITASLRRDGASQLADGHKWDWFPSAALAWRITDEPWMEKVKGNWLDDLKLRATYGVTGNAGIGVYGTQSGVTISSTGLGFQDTGVNHYTLGKADANGSGYYVIANKDTKWEKSTTYDVGFDAYLFNNRINVVFDWYYTKTTDLILLRGLPTSAGAAGKYGIYTNIGSTRNTGVEFTINARAIEKKNFKWNTALTFSANSEKILDLVDGKDITLGSNKEYQTLMIGHPIQSYNTFSVAGIWTSSEAADAAVFGQVPGDIKINIPNMERVGEGQYVKNGVTYTKDNQYKISQSDDIGYVGSTSPDWFAGFNNDFTIGNFDVNIYFYARFGQWAENRMANYTPTDGGKYTNMDYWVSGTNEGGILPSAYAGRPFYNYTGYQGFWYADNSFIKLKRVTLGYTFPKSWMKTIGINKIRVYATVNDPLYWVKSKYQKGYDPEDAQRSITFGLSVNL